MIKKTVGFMGDLVVGSAAIGLVGASNMSSGLKGATQDLLAVGILSKGAGLFKWK